MAPKKSLRRLVVVFGDQLDPDASAFDGFDPACDAVWMAEAATESEHVWSTKMRIAVFLAAMRHFRDALRERDIPVHYRELPRDGAGDGESLFSLLSAALQELRPGQVVCTEPGEWRVAHALKTICGQEGVALEVRPDRHFFVSTEDFSAYADGRKALRMEYFYREQRKRFGILMSAGKPEGGAWNFDADNREHFEQSGPGKLPKPPRFEPDDTTRAVIDLVRARFGDHPGRLDSFAWAVTRKDAERALKQFVKERLPYFGPYQDAMWTDEWHVYHSLLSSCLNLKLLNPREVVDAACRAYADGDAPLNSVEGFVRQILGWREFVRGIYWLKMPGYLKENELEAHEPLPDFYWTGETPLRCLQEAIGQTLEHGYAHHIQRLMVTGLYALLLGVDPVRVHEWYLAVYVDAVEWVELPNTLGMSQFADGGAMASKPYAATGKYINRMSNYCAHCPKNPEKAVGAEACPFTTLYWDFLLRNSSRLKQNQRMTLQLKNLERLGDSRRRAIQKRAAEIRSNPALCDGKN